MVVHKNKSSCHRERLHSQWQTRRSRISACLERSSRDTIAPELLPDREAPWSLNPNWETSILFSPHFLWMRCKFNSWLTKASHPGRKEVVNSSVGKIHWVFRTSPLLGAEVRTVYSVVFKIAAAPDFINRAQDITTSKFKIRKCFK